MVTTAELVARAVLQNAPYVRCFPCLSSQVGVSEKDTREAAQLLVVREEFVIARRMCQICGRADDVLVSGKALEMDRAILRDVIRRKLYDGALPSDPPRDRIYAGHGSGATCDACGNPIQPAQVEYELNYPDEARTFRLHLGCADLWDAVRSTRGPDPAR